MLAPALLLAFSALLGAQELWPPRLPALALAPSRPQEKDALSPFVIATLERMAVNDTARLGVEADKVRDWAASRDSVALKRGEGKAWLAEGAETLAVSPQMADALAALDRYFASIAAAADKPVTHEALARAALSPQGVAAVQGLYERLIAQMQVVGGKPTAFETGGEALLHDGLALNVMADPTRAAAQRLLGAREDPAALARVYAQFPQAMKNLDPGGVLKRKLDEYPRWPSDAKPRNAALIRMAVDAAVETSAGSFVLDPVQQLEAIVASAWTGRRIGFWHAHPPHHGDMGWTASDEPSAKDLELAAELGQFLTINFLPDGFDLHDLSGLTGAPGDRDRIRTIKHRDPEWRRRFQALYDALKK